MLLFSESRRLRISAVLSMESNSVHGALTRNTGKVTTKKEANRGPHRLCDGGFVKKRTVPDCVFGYNIQESIVWVGHIFGHIIDGWRNQESLRGLGRHKSVTECCVM